MMMSSLVRQRHGEQLPVVYLFSAAYQLRLTRVWLVTYNVDAQVGKRAADGEVWLELGFHRTHKFGIRGGPKWARRGIAVKRCNVLDEGFPFAACKEEGKKGR